MSSDYHDRWRQAVAEIDFLPHLNGAARQFLLAAHEVGQILAGGARGIGVGRDPALVAALARARLSLELISVDVGVPLDVEAAALLVELRHKAPEIEPILRKHRLIA